MRIKRDPFAYWHLPLYYYLIRSYSKFKFTGQCMDFPLSIQIQTQSFCNGKCLICPYPTFSKQLEQGEMTDDLHSKIINELESAPLLAQMVYELHNEPLLDNRIFNWVNRFKSINPDKDVEIVTNGELLDQFNIEDINNSNLNTIIISLNANSKEMFAKINCNLDYERIIKNINHLLENNFEKQKITLSFVLTDLNEHEVRDAVQHWHKIGLATRIIELTNRAGTLANFDNIRLKNSYTEQGTSSSLRSTLTSPVKRWLGCSLPFYQMNVLFNGDVIICCHDWNRATIVGNVNKSSLKEIWNSEKLNKARQLILNKNYSELDSCRNCSSAI